MDFHFSKRALLVIVVLGVVLRAAVVLVHPVSFDRANLLPDEVQYLDMGQAYTEGRGLPDELGFQATRMPLYPVLLGLHPPMSVWGVLILQIVLGGMSAAVVGWLAFRIAIENQVEHAKIVGYLAAILVAIDPFGVYFTRFYLTETLFTFFLCAFAAVVWPLMDRKNLWGWGRCLVAGMLFVVCVYLRPSVALFLGVWSVYLLARWGWDRTGWAGVIGLWAILIVSLVPWAWRNQEVTGRWVWLTTRGGISLYDGVRPGATGESDLGQIKQCAAVQGMSETEWDDYFRGESWRIIRAEPDRIVRLAWAKFCRTWSPWPNAGDYQNNWIRISTGSWTCVILLMAVVGVFRGRIARFDVVGLLLPAIYFTLVHTIYVGSVRYRIPVMPMIEILSAIGIVLLVQKLRMLRRHS